MKLASKRLMLAVAMLGFTAASSASTISFSGGNTQSYSGAIDSTGYDLFTLSLTQPEELLLNVTTAQDTGALPKKVNEGQGVVHLHNITGVDLLSSSNTVLASTAAAYVFTPMGGQYATLTSTATLLAVQLLNPGTYYLRINGDRDTTYSGSITATPSAVPLPGAALLFGSGLLGLGVLGRKKSKSAATPEGTAA